MTSDWYLLLFGASFLFAGISNLVFARITVHQINQKIEAQGLSYVSNIEKIGYTQLSMAIAILFRREVAERFIPPLFFDIEMVKENAVYPRDTIISSLYLTSVILILITLALSAIFL